MGGSIQQPEPVGVVCFRPGGGGCSAHRSRQEARPGETAEQFPPPPPKRYRTLLPGVNDLMAWISNHRSTVSQGRSEFLQSSSHHSSSAKQLVRLSGTYPGSSCNSTAIPPVCPSGKYPCGPGSGSTTQQRCPCRAMRPTNEIRKWHAGASRHGPAGYPPEDRLSAPGEPGKGLGGPVISAIRTSSKQTESCSQQTCCDCS
jgi:hypothetical protein